MPILSAIGSSSALAYGFSRSPSNPLWLSFFDGSSFRYTSNSIAADLLGNAYVVGWSDLLGTASFFIAKYDKAGDISWERILSGASSSVFNNVRTSISGNIYAAGTYGSNTGLIAKYDSSGSIIWQKTLSGSGTTVNFTNLAIDTSENIYVVGYATISGNTSAITVKYDSSGNIIWQRSLALSGSQSYANGITTDLLNNIYISGYAFSSADTNYYMTVYKYDSSGNLQWQRKLDSPNSDTFSSISSDGNNIYISGTSYVSGNSDIFIAKYDANGLIQWQKKFGGGSTESSFSISTDLSGNSYVAAAAFTQGQDMQIIKYDTLGNILWQRRLGGISTESGRGIQVDNNGNFYISGTNQYYLNAIVSAKLPGDGSLAGSTYSLNGYSFNYQTTNFAASNVSLSESSANLISSTLNLTSGNSSLTNNIISSVVYKATIAI